MAASSEPVAGGGVGDASREQRYAHRDHHQIERPHDRHPYRGEATGPLCFFKNAATYMIDTKKMA